MCLETKSVDQYVDAMTPKGDGISQSDRFNTRPLSMSNMRTACTSLIGAVALVILVVILKEGPVAPPTFTVPQAATAATQSVNVVVEHRHFNIVRNKTLWDYNWDKRAWKSADEAKDVPARTLYLVRHGKYDFKTGHLDNLGMEQAHLTGKRLKEMNIKFTGITHSTMPRAVETAMILCQYLNLTMTADDMLIEGGPVVPKPTITYWGLPDTAYHVDGPRMEGAFRKYFHRADRQQKAPSYEILVGHGNLFRYFTLRALQFPPEAWMRIFIAHASITVIHLNPDGTVNMKHLGDAGHFPPEKVTF
ncbi:Serine/threonine-protein phosphatase PGAM5, mitochondrial [Lamellibrachia satsuma]|nr:Serine/threonine-protein phosphatase PGAM5, mitochondrial [Lamellibrachia satsuma]